jgi:hypothetical protein
LSVRLPGRVGTFPNRLEGFECVEFFSTLAIRCLISDDDYVTLKPTFPDGYEALAEYREPHLVKPSRLLRTSQDYIDLEHVAHVIEHGAKRWALTIPYHGHETIWDGHHRIVARRLLNKPAYVIGACIDTPLAVAA